jgi:hypothetical protein
LNAFVKSDQPLRGFKVVVPTGYGVIGAGGAYVGVDQVGSCTANTNTLACSFTEQPARTEVRAVLVTGDEGQTMYKRLPDGAGSTLYLVSPRAAGPFSLTGP